MLDTAFLVRYENMSIRAILLQRLPSMHLTMEVAKVSDWSLRRQFYHLTSLFLMLHEGVDKEPM